MLRGSKDKRRSGPFDVARFFGPDNQGVVEFDPPTLDRANQRATVFMRALHVPRNIDRIRFRPETSKPLQVELVPSNDGGLLEGWSLSGPDAGGWYEASSGTPLEFGSLGLLAKLTFSSITEDSLGSTYGVRQFHIRRRQDPGKLHVLRHWRRHRCTQPAPTPVPPTTSESTRRPAPPTATPTPQPAARTGCHRDQARTVSGAIDTPDGRTRTNTVCPKESPGPVEISVSGIPLAEPEFRPTNS